MHCLESVYEKLVGKPLTYTALMGKPSEITYMYAEQLINRISAKMGLNSPVRTLYAIGYVKLNRLPLLIMRMEYEALASVSVAHF